MKRRIIVAALLGGDGDMATLLTFLLLCMLGSIAFHALSRHRRNPEAAEFLRSFPMFPRDPLLMAILFDVASFVLLVLVMIMLVRPDVFAWFEW
jgi:hypothetical protein